MVQNFTSSAASNATSIQLVMANDLIYWMIGIIFTLLLFIAGLLYKTWRSDLDRTKSTIDSELKVLNEKYNTSEKIKTVELEVANIEYELRVQINKKSDLEYVQTNMLDIIRESNRMKEDLKLLAELDSRIKELEEQLKEHKRMHPAATPSLIS